jgi:hypothetical protein
MSSPFLNKLLFFPEPVTIRDLEPYFSKGGQQTCQLARQVFTPSEPQPTQLLSESQTPILSKPQLLSESHTPLLPKPQTPLPSKPQTPPLSKPYPKSRSPECKPTLFWCIFLAIYEYGEYMEAIRRSGNREIEEKLRMVDSLKKSPKILKESNSKLTIEQTQALYGSLATSREDRIEFCAAYAAYYKKTIWLLYPKTYRVFSPTTEVSTDSDAIVIKVSPGPKHSFLYSLDQDSDIKTLVGERTGLLQAQSKYKTAELVPIANKLGVSLEPKAKKQEVYDAIRVAIHKDMKEGT